jgi:hypothetical protein
VNVSADQVRTATRTAAAVITADKLPPLRLDESPGSHVPARRTRPAWLAPLAAAAAVVLVVAGSVAAAAWFARPGNGRLGSGRPARLGVIEQGAPAASYAGVPAYYVALDPSLAVVRATATGATLARITARTPFVGVTGAADDRTFVLDAQRQAGGPAVQSRFYLLRLSASGAEAAFTPLALPALPGGTVVTGLALSPDGSQLAVEVDSGTNGQPGLLEIGVYTLATGAFRTWSANGSGDSVDPFGFTGSGVTASQTISWAADSRTLAFDWRNQSYIGVRLLDTAASGDNLIADSRLAVIEASLTRTVSRRPLIPGPPDYISRCVTDSIISVDGSAIVCGYTTTTNTNETTTGFIRYSVSTGKPTPLISVFQFQGQAPGDISLYWTDSTGKVLVGGILAPGGVRVGVINGEKFTPLPGTAGLGAAAW